MMCNVSASWWDFTLNHEILSRRSKMAIWGQVRIIISTRLWGRGTVATEIGFLYFLLWNFEVLCKDPIPRAGRSLIFLGGTTFMRVHARAHRRIMRLTYARPPTNYTPFRETQRVSVANDGVIWIGGLSVAKTGMIKSRPRRAKRVSRINKITRVRPNRNVPHSTPRLRLVVPIVSESKIKLAGRVTTADFGTKLVASSDLTAKCQSIPARVRGRRAFSSSQSIL